VGVLNLLARMDGNRKKSTGKGKGRIESQELVQTVCGGGISNQENKRG